MNSTNFRCIAMHCNVYFSDSIQSATVSNPILSSVASSFTVALQILADGIGINCFITEDKEIAVVCS